MTHLQLQVNLSMKLFHLVFNTTWEPLKLFSIRKNLTNKRETKRKKRMKHLPRKLRNESLSIVFSNFIEIINLSLIWHKSALLLCCTSLDVLQLNFPSF
jgi:hypothetical protein